MVNLRSHLEQLRWIDISSSSEDLNSCYKKRQGKAREERYNSIHQLIEESVLPKWVSYMKSKIERREGDAKKKPRTDTFRKKILRDMREFYRTLFRRRFHLSEYKTIEDIKTWLRTLFDELGISLGPNDLNDFQLFRYVHQTHQYTTRKIVRHRNGLSLDSPFMVIERYNENNLKKFLMHPLSSKMFYFLFENYSSLYNDSAYPYMDKVISIISKILLSYKSMATPDHLKNIEDTLS